MVINEFSCGGIVYIKEEEHKFLVIKQRNTNHYSFPKGHMELNETKVETAYREIYEETNIKTIIDQDNYLCSYYKVGNNNKEVTYFLAKALNINIIIQEEEILFAGWLTEAEVLNVLTYDNDLEIFKKLIKNI